MAGLFEGRGEGFGARPIKTDTGLPPTQRIFTPFEKNQMGAGGFERPRFGTDTGRSLVFRYPLTKQD